MYWLIGGTSRPGVGRDVFRGDPMSTTGHEPFYKTINIPPISSPLGKNGRTLPFFQIITRDLRHFPQATDLAGVILFCKNLQLRTRFDSRCIRTFFFLFSKTLGLTAD